MIILTLTLSQLLEHENKTIHNNAMSIFKTLQRLQAIKTRLEYLRRELRACHISYGEIAELQSLAKYIDPGDVELLEAAGVPEFTE